MANILVTGGAGFIGSHVCKMLRNSGHTPIAFDNLSRGFKSAVKWGDLVIGDIHDERKLEKTMEKYSPEAIMHFAAYAYVGESVEHPELYQQNNVEGTRALLRAMNNHGLNNLVFSSSCATYGTPASLPIKEGDPQNPINPYGQSKLDIENDLQQLALTSNLNFCALRYFNAAGSDPDGEIGESHDPEPHIIPNVIKAALGTGPELKIFGNDYPTPDGTCIRDFIHVSDLAIAHLHVLESLLSNKTINPFYNLGNTKGFSLLEIIKETENVLNKTVPYSFAPRRVGDPAELIGSSEKFKKDFSWSPKNSDIKTIIATSAEWIKRL